eukprot:TRINITY_DN9240_c0_g1_i1.p1 TRINITY_DN9240_c0_g1~~TRINITY_DN9240_c0_g1_i1.p1  ORF type:complete len:399 (+),score=101.43 TRINITY_DN9240_c0_g1_i1:59-1255(+)
MFCRGLLRKRGNRKISPRLHRFCGVDAAPKLPVSILSGFLGSGKTTLLTRVLNNTKGLKVAVIVNELSSLNIDAAMVKLSDPLSPSSELVEMSNGCICCNLRPDLLEKVTGLAKKDKFDYLFIESSGIAEPLPIASTFSFLNKLGENARDTMRLDTMVTMVDASHFIDNIKTADTVTDRKLATIPDDQRTIVDLLIDQIEFANVILLNKTDLVSPNQAKFIETIIKKLNPLAKVHQTVHSNIELDSVMNTNLFDFDEVASSPGWLQEISGTIDREHDLYGISSFTYKSNRPFDPHRLHAFLQNNENVSKIVRSKGFFWLGTDPDDMLVWSSAGRHYNYKLSGRWKNDQAKSQQIVFIGIGLNEKDMVEGLDEACMSDEELEKVDVKNEHPFRRFFVEM